jgi:hypothetical protein
MASENQGGSRSSTSSRAVSAAQKQRKALELRRAGASFDVIAQQVGYSSTGGAYKAVQTGLKKLVREPGESVRKLELERLDRLLLAVWYKAVNGDLGALDRALKIIAKRCEIEGVNAPVRVKHGGDDDSPPIRMQETIDWSKVPQELKEKLLDLRNAIVEGARAAGPGTGAVGPDGVNGAREVDP